MLMFKVECIPAEVHDPCWTPSLWGPGAALRLDRWNTWCLTHDGGSDEREGGTALDPAHSCRVILISSFGDLGASLV